MVKIDDIEEALMYVSADGIGENHAWLCHETGKIYWHSEDYDNVEELPDDVDSDKYIEIPNKHDLDLGRRLVWDFTEEFLADHEDKVRDMFHHRGAYRRFKDLLEYSGQLTQWYRYEEAETRRALLAWCAANDIEVNVSPIIG